MQEFIKNIKVGQKNIVSDLLTTGVSQTIENQLNKQRDGFLGMLLSTSGANLLGSMFAGKKMIRAGDRVKRAGLNLKVFILKKTP